MKKEDLEIYSIWIRINNAIAGPYLLISFSYIVIFILVTTLIMLKPEVFKLYMIYYIIGIPLFIISVWIAFIGSMLREENG